MWEVGGGGGGGGGGHGRRVSGEVGVVVMWIGYVKWGGKK